MNNFVLIAVFIFLLVLVQSSKAQNADDVIIKYESARGGRDNMAAIKSIYIEGKRRLSDNEVPVRIIKEQNKLSRIELDTTTGTAFILITALTGWSYFPEVSAAPELMPADALAWLQQELDIAGPLVDHASKGHKAQLLGKDVIGGDECHKIKLNFKNGKDAIYWIDVSTGLLLQSIHKTAADETKILYKNYKETGGIKFPHEIETHTGLETEILLIDQIELNKPIEPNMYEPK